MEKIVNFCPNGSETTKENSLAPIFPNEVIEEVIDFYEKQLITLVHIHARDKNGKPSSKVQDFSPIIEGIRKYCPDLTICASLSGRYFNTLEERSAVLDLKPDMGSLTMSSWNYKTGVNINSPQMIVSLAEKMNKLGIVPELECFDAGMLNYVNYLIKKKTLKSPNYINMIFGNLSNAQLNIDTVSDILNNKPENSIMCFGGIGGQQLEANLTGIYKADGCRIGLEDNLYNLNNEKTTNFNLLKRIKVYFKGYIMKPKDFKQWLQS